MEDYTYMTFNEFKGSTQEILIHYISCTTQGVSFLPQVENFYGI